MTTLDFVRELLANQLHYDVETISETTNVIEDLAADSLDIVEMLMEIETEYGVHVPDDEIANLKTVGDIAKFVDDNK